EPAGTRFFDPDERSIRIVSTDTLRIPRETLWGLQRSDGSWLIKPQFHDVDALNDGLARARVSGKVGFIDRSGQFVIDPVFDEASAFAPGFASTPVRQGMSAGVIDRTGTWVFKTNAGGLQRAVSSDSDGGTQFGWHFRRHDRWEHWGLLDLD